MRARNIVIYFLFLSLGIALAYAAFNKINWSELSAMLAEGNYYIAFPVFLVSVSGYFFRIARWQIMLNSCNEVASKKSLFTALCMAYGVNFVVPRLGELTRCLVVKRTDKVPFDKSFITVIAERMIDTLCLFFLLLMLLLMMQGVIAQFLTTQILHPILQGVVSMKWIVLFTSIAGLAAIYLIGKYWRKHVGNYIAILMGLRNSLINYRFWFYTIMIWVCYFLMTFLWFYTFDATKSLTLKDAFLLMVVGSIGRSVPVQGGGLGAYHYLVANVAVLVGLSLTEGNALAIVIHGIQSIFTFILALFTYIWFILQKRY
jgi:uncharacterized membrane protein YbhN (UPF0104 family)